MADLDFTLPAPHLAQAMSTALQAGEGVLPLMARWSAALEDPRTAAGARALAGEILTLQDQGQWPVHLIKVCSLGVSWGGAAHALQLVLTGSVFAPEDWSRTFLEGLLRRPARDWHGASVVEVGTGSGWVSIALCLLTEVREILALDLNPEAVACARLNVRLAAVGADGRGVGPRPLWERITCEESDLLSVPLARGMKLDAIVGCIPQVLQPPSSEVRSRTQELYDLSNYAAVQGLVEDRFGLGLNAAALDQAFGCLSERGAVVLNLAIRPGVETVRQLFTRRGLKPRTLWRARIRQAEDTAIDSLVELERETGQDFEFYLHRHSPHPVPAATAREVLRAGGEVWHELKVVEGRPALAERGVALVGALTRLGVGTRHHGVDLAQVDDEQAAFVLRLAAHLERDPTLPYPHEAGDLSLRTRVAAYLTRYTGRRVEQGSLFVGPGRVATYCGLLMSLMSPGQRVLVTRSLRPVLAPVAERLGVILIPAPDSIVEVTELLTSLEPHLLVLSVLAEERQALGQLGVLLGAAHQRQVPVIIDETDFFEITSRATGGGLLGALAESQVGRWPLFLVALERSRVYPGLAVTLVCHPDRRLHHRLEAAAELTWSRIGWLPQFYYEGLFEEMTMFRMWEGGTAPGHLPPPAPSAADGGEVAKRPAPLLEEAMTLPGLARPAPDPDVVRLDYGENEATLPPSVVQGLLASMLDRDAGRPDAALERQVATLVGRYVAAGRGVAARGLGVAMFPGTWPALFDTLLEIRRLRARLRVAVPRGCYGLVIPQLLAAGAEVVTLETRADDGLRLRPAALRGLSPSVDAVLLCQPTNPSGLVYTQGELDALAREVEARGAWLLSDEVFAHVHGTDRLPSILATPDAGTQRVVFGGVSKAFAAGGLRVGWALSPNVRLIEEIQRRRLEAPPRYALSTVRHLLTAGVEEGTEGTLGQWLRAQGAWLASQRALIEQELEPLGIPVLPGVGALSVLVDLRQVAGESGADAWVLELERVGRVRINTPSWSTSPGMARICTSQPEARLREGLRRIAAFVRADGASFKA